VTASLWQRPVVPEGERVALSRRQGHAAAALLRLGGAPAWPLLAHTATPDARSYLVARLAGQGVPADAIVKRLEVEKDVTARAALILALGEYGSDQLPPALRARLVPRLLGWYREDSDAGVHGAIDWLLRHQMEGPQPRKLDWGQARELERIDRALANKPEAPARGPHWHVSPTGLTMTVLPGPVEFLMGSPAHEPDGIRAQETLHRRRINRDFALATRPVTVSQWQQFLSENRGVKYTANQRDNPDPQCPITNVSWYDAAQYCRWLSEKEGVREDQMCYPPVAVIQRSKDGRTPLKLPADYLRRTGYRLPTEAEWEYACRAQAGTARSYGAGKDLLARYAWYSANSLNRTWPVGQKRPNDFGLFDMHGNLWQWCHEPASTYRIGRRGRAVEDEEDARDVTDAYPRVQRGAAYDYLARYLRSARRNAFRPRQSGATFGFRVARTVRDHRAPR
jgi:formylglycine-generating enzyme required for sulfatase activity